MSDPQLYSMTVMWNGIEDVQQQLLAFIDESKKIQSWNKPFDGLFLIASSSSSEEIAQSIFKFLQGVSPFIISKLELGQNFGTLPEQSWQWFKEQGFKKES